MVKENEAKCHKGMKKYCHFYHYYRHDTEDCYQLKKKIEALIKQDLVLMPTNYKTKIH